MQGGLEPWASSMRGRFVQYCQLYDVLLAKQVPSMLVDSNNSQSFEVEGENCICHHIKMNQQLAG